MSNKVILKVLIIGLIFQKALLKNIPGTVLQLMIFYLEKQSYNTNKLG